MIHQKKIFTQEECGQIISFKDICNNIDNQIYFKKDESIIFSENRIILNELFSYDVYVILNNEETKWMFDKITQWFTQVTNVDFITEIDKCTLHRYGFGDKFAKHIDLNQNFKDRRYNLGIQLNDNYEGGEYICWDEDENEVMIMKEIGTALCYHSSVPHEIKQITRGERWSIVMPIKTNHIKEKINLI